MHATIVRSVIAIQLVLYFIIAGNAPLFIVPQAYIDDGLFMRVGHALAAGRWLGPYDQFTLIKGPGYPAFLALSNWLSLPVSLSHVLLHCVAISVFSHICFRLTRSAACALAIFTLLMWMPVAFTEPLLRVYREAIYYSQVLLAIGMAALALLTRMPRPQQLAAAAASGALFGWAWLTREEGVWLLPGLVLLAALAILREWRIGNARPIITAVIVLFGTFAASELSFRLANRLAYGSFVGNEIKSGDFRAALGAIHSVRSGGIKARVPVTRAARERIYQVSPAFASLASHLDSPHNGWQGLTCNLDSKLCGEIGAGFFLWGIRQAAALNGHHSSPQRAGAFYRKVAVEINDACAQKKLECAAQILPELPPITENILPEFSRRFFLALKVMTLWRYSIDPPASPDLGPTDIDYSEFLGSPKRIRNDHKWTRYRVQGWFMKSGDAWFTVEVGGVDQVNLERQKSPDLAQTDANATQQRFTMEGKCVNDCVAQVVSGSDRSQLRLSDLRNHSGYKLGEGMLYVENVQRAAPLRSSKADELARTVRASIDAVYNPILSPLILILGFISAIGGLVLYRRRMIWNNAYVLASICLILALTKVVVNTLVDVIAFPVVSGSYLAPAAYLLIASATLFIFAGVQQYRR